MAHTSAKPVGKRKYMGSTVEIGLDRWLELDESAWSLITARLQGRADRPSARLPRPHQEHAINAARAHYVDKGATHGRLIMPCGIGKSLTAFWIAAALDARNILVAVPSLALIRQSLADWTREFLARGEVLTGYVCAVMKRSGRSRATASWLRRTTRHPDYDRSGEDSSVPFQASQRTPDHLHHVSE